MREMLNKTEAYTLVILKAAQNLNEPEVKELIWEHGRKNFSLREEGKLSIVCPVIDGTDVKGVGIFSTGEEETRKIMEDDPAAKAGIFTHEIHLCRSFPGDMLPEKYSYQRKLSRLMESYL
jgi:hypothetical protein